MLMLGTIMVMTASAVMMAARVMMATLAMIDGKGDGHLCGCDNYEEDGGSKLQIVSLLASTLMSLAELGPTCNETADLPRKCVHLS